MLDAINSVKEANEKLLSEANLLRNDLDEKRKQEDFDRMILEQNFPKSDTGIVIKIYHNKMATPLGAAIFTSHINFIRSAFYGYTPV